jgi:hypothetical protein
MVRKRTLPSYYNPQINECDNLNVRRACAPPVLLHLCPSNLLRSQGGVTIVDKPRAALLKSIRANVRRFTWRNQCSCKKMATSRPLH